MWRGCEYWAIDAVIERRRVRSGWVAPPSTPRRGPRGRGAVIPKVGIGPGSRRRGHRLDRVAGPGVCPVVLDERRIDGSQIPVEHLLSRRVLALGGRGGGAPIRCRRVAGRGRGMSPRRRRRGRRTASALQGRTPSPAVSTSQPGKRRSLMRIRSWCRASSRSLAWSPSFGGTRPVRGDRIGEEEGRSNPRAASRWLFEVPTVSLKENERSGTFDAAVLDLLGFWGCGHGWATEYRPRC
jgi:hypothetical protein